MKSFKRYFRKTLALTLTFIFFTTSVLASFSDMNSHWAKKYVDDLAKNNVTQGYEDGTFRPDGSITVAEFAALLDRYYYQGFDRTGTGANTWADQHVSFLEKEGILFNYGSKNSNLTRIVALRIIISAINGAEERLKDYNYKTEFVDNHTINYNDYKYINFGVVNNVIDGYQDNTFQPNRIITRAEAAKMLFTIKHHPKFDIKKPSGSGEPIRPTDEIIRADGLFTDPEGLNRPIYVSREDYDANKEMEIRTPFTAEGSVWQNKRMGMFWMFVNTSKDEVEKRELTRKEHENLPNTDPDCENFIKLKGSTTSTKPEYLSATWTNGTFKFKPQDPVIKAVIYMRDSKEEDKSVKELTYRLNIRIEGEDYPDPEEPGGKTKRPSTEITVPRPFYPKEVDKKEFKTITWSYDSRDNVPYKESIVTLEKYENSDWITIYEDKTQADRKLIIEGNESERYSIKVKVVDQKGKESYSDRRVFDIETASPDIDLEVDVKDENTLEIEVTNETPEVLEKLFPTSYTDWKIEDNEGNVIVEGEGEAPKTVELDEKFEGGLYKVIQNAKNTLEKTATAQDVFSIKSYLDFSINPDFLFEGELATIENNSKKVKNETLEIKRLGEDDSKYEKLTLNKEGKFTKDTGTYQVRLSADGYYETINQRGGEHIRKSLTKVVTFATVKPVALLNVEGHKKMYKEIILDGSKSVESTNSKLQETHPIQFDSDKTQLTIVPLTEQNGEIDISKIDKILGKDKELIGGKAVFKGKRKQSIRIDEDGWYRASYKVYNGVKESDWYNVDFYVSADENIEVNIGRDKPVAYRNPDNELKGEVIVTVNYKSPDGDLLDEDKSILYISYDKNEDGDFTNDGSDSVQYVNKNDTRLEEYIKLAKTEFLENKVVYNFEVDNPEKNHFGNFKFDFIAVEKPRIPNFTELGEVPILQNNTFNIPEENKVILLDNNKPVIHLDMNKQGRVELQVIDLSDNGKLSFDPYELLQKLDLNRVKAKLIIYRKNGEIEILEN